MVATHHEVEFQFSFENLYCMATLHVDLTMSVSLY